MENPVSAPISIIPRLVPRRRKNQEPAEPAPATPELALPTPASELGPFKVPVKRILSAQDLGIFQASSAHTLLLAFVFGISGSVRGVTRSAFGKTYDGEPESDEKRGIATILAFLDDAEKKVDEYPPLDTGSRFGNPVFRQWLQAVQDNLFPSVHESLAVPSAAAAVSELSTYLEHSFGNATRLDYGSGHELNFLMWLLCLNRLSILPTQSCPMPLRKTVSQALALMVLPRYIRLMRRVQMAYYLEPAGSHGVWGLDDYQFVPFLFGAAQLAPHPHFRPTCVHNQDILDAFHQDYLYLDQVAFVNTIKNVDGLRWHSPMLDDISAATNWVKIEAGMKKMFVKEVLGKLPVMQHFLFGSIIAAPEGMSEEGAARDDHGGHKHAHPRGGAERSWDDCCGIRVPSSLGAFGEEQKKTKELRRLPFD